MKRRTQEGIKHLSISNYLRGCSDVSHAEEGVFIIEYANIKWRSNKSPRTLFFKKFFYGGNIQPMAWI